jgi:DNA-binding transcriptional regulator YiaG
LQKRLDIHREKEGENAKSISKETRRESHNAVLPSLRARQKAVLRILRERGDLTAQEIAAVLQSEGVTPTDERNYAAPRLTELCEMGLVQTVGKKVCGKTGRTVTVWSLADKADKRKPTNKDNAAELQIELSMKIWLNSLERGGKPKHHSNRDERREVKIPPLFS